MACLVRDSQKSARRPGSVLGRPLDGYREHEVVKRRSQKRIIGISRPKDRQKAKLALPIGRKVVKLLRDAELSALRGT